MTPSVESGKWWSVLSAMAGYIAGGLDYDDLDDDFVIEALEAQGHTRASIDKALDWLEMASLSGNTSEVFSMLQPEVSAHRIANPLETASFTEAFWQRFERYRFQGLICPDMAEKVLEGIRSVDMRDWDEDEIDGFFLEVVSASLPSLSEELRERVVSKGRSVPEMYS